MAVSWCQLVLVKVVEHAILTLTKPVGIMSQNLLLSLRISGQVAVVSDRRAHKDASSQL
jgi:hypothetical protein